MEGQNGKKSNVALYIIIAVVVVAVLAIVAFFVFGNDIRKETITAENYTEMLDKLDKKLAGQDDLYYLSYSVMYHIMQDGMTASADDPNAMYVNIYGKKVQELIDDGKKLMEDNGMSLDQVKQTLDQLSKQAGN